MPSAPGMLMAEWDFLTHPTMPFLKDIVDVVGTLLGFTAVDKGLIRYSE